MGVNATKKRVEEVLYYAVVNGDDKAVEHFKGRRMRSVSINPVAFTIGLIKYKFPIYLEAYAVNAYSVLAALANDNRFNILKGIIIGQVVW